MRWTTVPLMLAVAAPFAGCGGDDDPQPPAPRVKVAVTSPADTAVIDSDAVRIEGSVAPARAQVRVLGKTVQAVDGRFSTEVELEPGANVIDLSASADGRRPDVAAIRVVRRMPVEIPSLQGDPADTAVERLEALGLSVDVQQVGGFLDDILGGELRVCDTDPDEGETVRPGTTVTLEAARGC
jgi:beta-lactam-binding protein with PASTA domain